MACYVGLKLDKPVIRVAKKLLCGKILSNCNIELNGKILGYQVKTEKNIFVTVGHKISLNTATQIIKNLILGNSWYPESLRLADKYSKEYKKSWIGSTN